MPPSVDPKVLAVADRVLARNCSVATDIKEGLLAFVDSKFGGAFRRNARRHVQKGRGAAQSEAKAGVSMMRWTTRVKSLRG